MLARVEGEGGMHIEIHDGHVTDVKLNIFEPPRFYEAFLRGRRTPSRRTSPHASAASARSRTSSARAWRMEDACGVTVPDHDPGTMRRLLYCGEWIESHALHIYMLHAPDFLGYAGRHRDGGGPRPTSSSAGCG